MRFRIRTKFMAAFFIVAAILILNSLVSYIAMNKLSVSLVDLYAISKKQQINNDIHLLIHNGLRAAQNWVNTKDPDERKNFLKDSKKISLAFEELEGIISTDRERSAYRQFKDGYDSLYREGLNIFTIEDPIDAMLAMKSLKEKTTTLIEIGDKLQGIFANEMDSQIAFSNKTRNWTYTLLLIQSSVGIALAVILGIIISRAISRPLERLSHEAELLGKGESYRHIGIKTGDEIETLAERFNWMASRLEQTISNLKGNVAELEERESALAEAKKGLQETKDYLEGIVEHSADAIITSDLDGKITSWNKAAEMVYGFREEEVIGKFLPMIPEFLMTEEMVFIERIKAGDTIKNMETLRQKNDGTVFEINLTLSPILDPSGKVIGISGISRDLSEKKKMGEEILRKTRELSTLYFIGDAMRKTLNLNNLLRIILTSVTMGDGLGFNRAILFLLNEDGKVLKGMMGVGPSSHDEAWQIWNRIASEGKSLKDLLTGEMPWDEGAFVDRLAKRTEIPLEGEGILSLSIKNKRCYNIANAKTDPAVDPFLIQQFGTEAFATIPLIAKDRVIGLILVDNLFTKRPITEDDLRFLTTFANQAASAIENAQLFEKVAGAEAELRNIFDSITDMVFLVDKDFNIMKVNKTLMERLGMKTDEIIGGKCYDIFTCGGPKPGCPHFETLTTRKPAIQEIEDYTREGTFLVSTSPFLNHSGTVIGTIHILRDITEQRKMRERLLYSEKMAALGEMAAKIAHEIRNPLVSIGGFARRLEGKLRKAGIKEVGYVNIIVGEVNRLEGILQELMGFVKERPLVIQKTGLNKLIEDVFSLLSSSLRDRKIRVIKELYQGELEIPIDPEQLKQAIINIVNNAQQAIVGSGEIHIKTALLEDMVTIEISDTGVGIPKDVLENIFNPFFTTKSSGTGLGLAITHRIIEMHSGEIVAKSQEGVGTTFIIKLPLKWAEVMKG
ncbi:MAG: PAS domain S-box protein [Nitrospirota bacterium]